MRIFVNNKPRFFMLEESLYKRLKMTVAENNKIHTKGKNKIKLDFACFFINLISYRESVSKDKCFNGYVPLDSKILKKYQDNYKVYMDFLQKEKFIRSTTHNSYRGICKRYKLLASKAKNKFIRYNFDNIILNRKFFDVLEKRRTKASLSTGHITKWLENKSLSIDYEAAVNYTHDSKKLKDTEKEARGYAIAKIHNNWNYFQRDGKDNRLHSILTNLPKDLRQFLRCDDKPLTSMDIKSSQPYILCGLLTQLIIERDENRVREGVNIVKRKKIREEMERVILIMLRKTFAESDILELRAFKKIIEDSDIYDHLSQNYSEQFLRKRTSINGFSDKFYKKSLDKSVREPFETIRDYSKKVMLEYLYCDNSNPRERYKEVKFILPYLVTKFVAGLKEKNKKYFPIFLQNLEAHLVLDVTCKRIADINPEIPLYTIHDSIATTAEYVDVVKKELEEVFFDFFGVRPRIEKEYWGTDYKRAA